MITSKKTLLNQLQPSSNWSYCATVSKNTLALSVLNYEHLLKCALVVGVEGVGPPGWEQGSGSPAGSCSYRWYDLGTIPWSTATTLALFFFGHFLALFPHSLLISLLNSNFHHYFLPQFSFLSPSFSKHFSNIYCMQGSEHISFLSCSVRCY